jgi:hypothetical protein
LLLLVLTTTAEAQVGGSGGLGSTTTTSTKTLTIDQYTPVTDQVNDYSTTITAELANGTSAFSITDPAPFSGPTVQSAISTADAILSAAGQTFGSPSLQSNQLTLQSSVVTDVPGTPTSVLTAVTTVYIGPQTIYVGDNQANAFVIAPGAEDIDTLITDTITQPISEVTTNTYLTTQSYLITGSVSSASGPAGGGPSGGATAAPLPAAAWQGWVGLACIGLYFAPRGRRPGASGSRRACWRAIC